MYIFSVRYLWRKDERGDIKEERKDGRKKTHLGRKGRRKEGWKEEEQRNKGGKEGRKDDKMERWKNIKEGRQAGRREGRREGKYRSCSEARSSPHTGTCSNLAFFRTSGCQVN